MNIANEILRIRTDQNLTQEAFGALFHVTRQTVSNWENGKNYPDLQILVEMSEQFDISLDELLKGDRKMVQTIDRERLLAQYRKGTSVDDAMVSAGTGILFSCLLSPNSVIRFIMVLLAALLILIGRHNKSKRDKQLLRYIQESKKTF